MGLGNNVNIVIASNYQNMEIIRKMSCCKLALSLTYLFDTQSKIWLNIEAIWQVKLFSLAKEILPIRLTKKSCGFTTKFSKSIANAFLRAKYLCYIFENSLLHSFAESATL